MPVLGAAILLGGPLLIKPPGGSGDVPIHRSDFLLNTFVDIAIYDSRDESIWTEAHGPPPGIRKPFSRTPSGSEANRVEPPGATGTYPRSDDMTHFLVTALYYCERSGGAFDITPSPQQAPWNFNCTSPSYSSAEAIEEAQRLDYKAPAGRYPEHPDLPSHLH